MKNKDCLIVVPMKSLDESKSRLEKYIPREIINKIVLKLFLNTITIIQKTTNSIEKNYKLAVVTKSNEIVNLIKKKNLTIIDDTSASFLSDSIRISSIWAKNNGFSSICIIPADIANPDLSDLITLFSYPKKNRSAVICPSYDLGTNAMIISPPNSISYDYGKNSFLKHLESANNAGLNPVILNLKSLKYDIDNFNDLKNLFKTQPNFIENYKHD